MRNLKLLTLLATILSAQQAFAKPPFEDSGLTSAERRLIKQYADEQPTFNQFYSRDKDISDEAGKIDVVYTSNLNNDRLTKQFPSRTYLMRSCAAQAINEKLGKEYIVVNSDCYAYAYTEKPGFFKKLILTEHRQAIDYHAITSNARTCSELGSCSRPGSQTFNPADLSNAYAIFVNYYNKCTSDSCRMDMALVAYYGGYKYNAPVSEM